MRQRLITFAVFGLVLVALGEWGMRNGKFAGLDRTWLDFCVGNAGDRIKDPALTVIRIDDGYEPLRISGDENVPNDGTLSRLDYATILAFVAKFEPRSVAFLPTPSFDENIILNKTDIAPLKDAAMKLPKLLVASTVSNDGEQAKEAAPLAYPALKVEGDPSAILTFTRTVRYPDPQILANGVPAFRTLESARDLVSGGVLRIPLVAKRGDQVVASIVLAAVANHAGVALDQVLVKLDDGRPRVRISEALEVPIAADGTFLVPSRSGLDASIKGVNRDAEGKPREVEHLTSLTVDELAYTGEANDEVAKRILASFQSRFDSLKKKNLVLIGFDRTADRRIATETGETLSETNLIARAIATIQSGRHIHWWPSWARWFAVALVGGLAAILFRLPRAKFIPATLVALLAFFAVKVLVFSATLAWTPPFAVMSLFALILVIGLIVPGAAEKSTPKA
jgi:hypothetical protein